MAEEKKIKIQEPYFMPIFGVLSAADYIRDSLFGWDSGVWDDMQIQQDMNSITDVCVLLPYYVRRNNKDYETPLLTEIGKKWIATTTGTQIADIILRARMYHIRIIQYSINANKVGHEQANNRVSFAVYAHFDNAIKEEDIVTMLDNEMKTHIISKIDEVLKEKDAQIFLSLSYNGGQRIRNYAEMDELLKGGEGTTFTKGYF